MKLNSVVQFLILGISSVVILTYLQSILIPFVFAVLVWFLIRELRRLITLLPWIGKKLPKWFKNIVAFTAIIGTIFLLGSLLANSVEGINEKSPDYQNNIQVVIDQLDKEFGINLISEAEEYLHKVNLSQLFRSVLNSFSNTLSNIFLVIFCVLFLILEESSFPNKLRRLYTDKERHREADQMITEINRSISTYISLKTLVSLITGLTSYLALLLIGVDFAVFWAILIFLLNYIPTIGSLIATLFPALMALLQFAEFTPFLLVLIIVGSIQLVVGNFIEPKLMGNSLNISSLVVILSLAFWGVIWGVAGMILSVPVMVILIIIFSKFPSTKALAVILSAEGEV